MSEFKQLYERVIEQFGAYEKCKEMLNIPNIDFIMNAQGLREHMLQYRRANNIFEMDDYIIHDGELKVFAMWSTAIQGCAYIGYAYAEDGEMAHKDEFRHATDEEITAGHRL